MSENRGVGLDIGTMNLVSARHGESGGVVIKSIRDAFLVVSKEYKQMLKLSDLSFVENGDELIILGDQAMKMATILNLPPRRPLSQGLVSAGDTDALAILRLLIKNVVGEPEEEGEVCVFSIPANPIDLDRNNIYHQGVFENILEDLGYDPIPSNEAMAVIFSQCASTAFSGIGISYGSGMTNVAMAYKTIPSLEFSLARGGDWIDENAASAINQTPARMCAIKEGGIDLLNPKDNTEEAIAIYYKHLIRYTIDQIAKEFAKSSQASPPEPVPIVISGGTSLPENFLDLFRQVFERKRKRFPIQISEIRHADDPLNAVAAGMLLRASQES